MEASIYKILPFDAEVGTTVKFYWTGSQVFYNRCVVKDVDTGTTVYDKKIEDFKLQHVIGTDSGLENGRTYNVFLTVFDADGNESDMQTIGMQCLCLKTPVFGFSNLTQNATLEVTAYKFQLKYSQENGESLDSWSISVYDKNRTLLATSGIQYNPDNTSDLAYKFSGFSNDDEYYAIGEGTTINGMPLKTEEIHFSISYSTFSVFSLLEPLNMPKIGAIQLRSNIVSSEGHLTKKAAFIDGEFLDLRNDVMTYGEGFAFKGNFSFVALFYGMKTNQDLIVFYGENPAKYTATLRYEERIVESGQRKGLITLEIWSYGYGIYLASNYIELPGETGEVGVCVVRNNMQYSIQAVNYNREKMTRSTK